MSRRAGWLLLLLAVPRLVRMLAPVLWIEDDLYLANAWMVAAGLRPYRDFIYPHMPLLELLLGTYLQVVGASFTTIEAVNEAAIYVTSLLTFALARRLAGRRVALWAALLYAWSALPFRYHLYARECFVAPLVLAATLVMIEADPSARRRHLWASGLWVVAMAVKLTAAIPCGVVVGYLALARQRWRQAVGMSGAVALGMALLTALCYGVYGDDFLFQVFVFHFLKGRDTPARLALYPTQLLDVLGPGLVLGLAMLAGSARALRHAGLILALLSSGYLFYGWLSPTAWGHNYLELLPFVTVIAGLGFERWRVALVRVATRTAARRGGEWTWAGGGTVLLLVMLTMVSPLVNEQWLRGSVYGFGYVPRAEAEALSAALAAATTPDEAVIAPPFLCYQAHRRPLVAYPETYGVYRMARAEVARQGLLATRRAMGTANFFALLAGTAPIWADQMRDAIVRGTVNAVIPDAPLLLLPLVRPPLAPVDPPFLMAQGFRPGLVTAHFVLWTRAQR